jgi:cell division transport system permease protein
MDWIEFVVSEALVALRRNLLMTFAAITTYAATVPDKFEMRVFFKDGTKFPAIKQTVESIRQMTGIKQVTYIPRDKMWERDQQRYPLYKDFENPYPDALKVMISDLAKGDSLASAIRKLPTVEPENGVKYLAEEQRLIDQLLRIVRWLGGALGALLLLIGGILIYNAIRLTVLSRRLELRIMNLVGASGATIRIPFIIEGLVHGLVGGALAVGLLMIANKSVGGFVLSINSKATLPDFPWQFSLFALCSIGAVYGVLCSSLAVRKPLQYR